MTRFNCDSGLSPTLRASKNRQPSSNQRLLVLNIWIYRGFFCLSLCVLTACAGAGLTESDPEEEEEEQAPPIKKDYTLYLSLGASTTAGANLNSLDDLYVAQVYNRLRTPWPELQLDNRGVGGRRMTQMIADLKDLGEDDIPLVTIFPSTDYAYTAPEQFQQHAKALLDALEAYELTVIWGDRTLSPDLVCGTGEGPGGCYGEDTAASLILKNKTMAELAESYDWLFVVALEDQQAAKPEWYNDDKNINAEGHTYLADLFIHKLEVLGILDAEAPTETEDEDEE